MKDGFNRQITYARISVTDLCNMRCKYCMPEGVEKKPHDAILSIEELCQISDTLADLGVEKQRITGGEPLVRRGVMQLLRHIGANEKVKKLAITTNGQLLGDMAAELKEAGVNAVNISIDTLDEDKFKELTKGGDLSLTLRGVKAAASRGFESVKLNAVLLRGVNDDEIYRLACFARDNKMPMRFIELMPFASQYKYAKEYFISMNDVVKTLNLQYIEEKSQCKKEAVYRFADGVEVSFISPVSNKFCSECNRIRISADGKLLNCLHECVEYDLRPFIGDKAALAQYIEECVLKKPKEHHLSDGVLQKRPMENIGG